ncbi:MAG: hypothetical protein HY666_06720 [Chloroflexi bacterium]|nr:hypothetical protein [Chloroflexota bacterium]
MTSSTLMANIVAVSLLTSAVFFIAYLRLLVTLRQSQVPLPDYIVVSGFLLSLVVEAWGAVLWGHWDSLQGSFNAGVIVAILGIVSLVVLAASWWRITFRWNLPQRDSE